LLILPAANLYKQGVTGSIPVTSTRFFHEHFFAEALFMSVAGCFNEFQRFELQLLSRAILCYLT